VVLRGPFDASQEGIKKEINLKVGVIVRIKWQKNQVSPPSGDYGRKLVASAFNRASTKSFKV
jgi:hypothetical protein